jgi:hypothetical protein
MVGKQENVMLDRVKLVAHWAGPAVGLLFFYMAIWGVPSLPVTGLLAGAGLLVSWGMPWVAKKIKGLLGK